MQPRYPRTTDNHRHDTGISGLVLAGSGDRQLSGLLDLIRGLLRIIQNHALVAFSHDLEDVGAHDSRDLGDGGYYHAIAELAVGLRVRHWDAEVVRIP